MFAYFLALCLGSVVAFFVVFNSIFSDVSSLGDRVATLILTAAVYSVLGAGFGAFFQASGWKWGVWISLPALVLVGWYSTHEPDRTLLHLAYLALVAGSASFAAHITAKKT
jgi:MFS family permease